MTPLMLAASSEDKLQWNINTEMNRRHHIHNKDTAENLGEFRHDAANIGYTVRGLTAMEYKHGNEQETSHS